MRGRYVKTFFKFKNTQSNCYRCKFKLRWLNNDKANILEWETVEILNINNGERFQTYAIKGARGSKCFCLNGAAARKAQPGDKIIIVTYAELTPEEIKTHKPTIVQVGEGNSIVRQ